MQVEEMGKHVMDNKESVGLLAILSIIGPWLKSFINNKLKALEVLSREVKENLEKCLAQKTKMDELAKKVDEMDEQAKKHLDINKATDIFVLQSKHEDYRTKMDTEIERLRGENKRTRKILAKGGSLLVKDLDAEDENV